MVSAGMIWDWLMDPNLGLINTVLSFLGVDNLPLWLRGTETALYSAIIINLWIRCPFGILIFIGGVKNIPQSYYEAAMIDGASAIKRFFKITLPLLNPQIIMILTLETIFGFKIFDTIYASTGGGPAGSTKTIMIYLIKDVYQKDYGMASAITVLLVLCLFTISLLQQVFLTKRVEY
jgi:ABC-type sugar transport system permease subunit